MALAVSLAVPSLVMAHCGHCGRCGSKEPPVLMQIGVTPSQARRLLPIFENAMRLRADHYRKMAELMPAMLETYEAFRAEDERNQGFSKEVEQATARLHHQEIQLADRLGQELLKLEEEVKKVLSDRQLRALAQPHRPGPGNNPHAMVGNIAGGNMTAVATAVDSQAAETVKKMREIGQYRHPRATQIGDRLLKADLLDELHFVAVARPSKDVLKAVRTIKEGTRKFPRPKYDALQRERGRLGGEISAWNLVNGLHLNKGQAVTIARCAQAAAALREHFRKGPAVEGICGEEKLAAQLAVAPAVVEDLYRFERKVIDVLSDTQVQVIRDFKPCLLPPKDLDNPVRVGQANDNTALTRFLTQAGNLPSAQHAAAVDRWLSCEEKHHGKYDDDYRAHRRQLLLGTLDQVAQMDETELAVHVKDLAERAQPVDVQTELRFELEGIFSSRQLPGPIAKSMLFDRHMVKVLATRADQLSRPVKLAKRDLTKGPQAENCDNSKCALPGRKNGKPTR